MADAVRRSMPPLSAASNPFATQFIAPGAIRYRLEQPGGSLSQLIDRLIEIRCGAIVGPHGSGKSSLLAALRQPLADREGQLFWWRLPDPAASEQLRDGRTPLDQDDLLVIDGYEQLTLHQQWRLQAQRRRQGFRLLVTSHARPWGIPRLLDTRPTLVLARQLVAELLQEHAALRSDYDRLVLQRWPRFGGNLRELLFDLYDEFERRRGQRGGLRPRWPLD